MYILALINALFSNGGAAYTYSDLKNWLTCQLGLNSRQVAGTIGAGVRYGFLIVTTYANENSDAIFTR